MSTRLIGGLLMTHSDDDGFVLPPRLAPAHVVIIPIFRSDEERPRVLEYCHKVAAELRGQRFADAAVRVHVDARDVRGGEKVWQWVRKGVPVRLEIGPRDIEKDSVFAARRDRAPKDKQSVARAEFVATIAATLQSIQEGLFSRARRRSARSTRGASTTATSSMRSSRASATATTHRRRSTAASLLTHFGGEVALEQKIKDDLSVTVRCIPLEKGEPGVCPFTGKPSAQRVIWAKAY